MKHAFLVDAAVSMRAKIIALCLQKVCGEAFLAVTVNVAQRIAERRDWSAKVGGGSHDLAQTVASFVDELAEKGIEHQILQILFGLEGGSNRIQQFGADDAAAFPDSRDLVKFQTVFIFLRGEPQLLKPLRITGDGGKSVGLAHAGDELIFVAGEFARGSLENLGSGDAILAGAGKDSGNDAGIERGNGHAELHGVLSRPFARAFLFGGVEHKIHQRFLGIRIDLAQNDNTDFNEERIQIAGIPLAENIANFRRGESNDIFENIVRFADGLHDAVLDSVMDHLDVVA